MEFTRRQFIKTSMAMSAASAFPSIWLRARQASALQSCEQGVNLVIVQLDGGNDGINMVVPMTDGTGKNRSAYDTVRTPGGLNIPVAGLGTTQIGDDPLHSSGGSNAHLALHPHMVGLKGLYDSGNLAVLCGVHYPEGNLSHDVSKTIWYRADPALSGAGTGWMGRTLDQVCAGPGQSSAVPAADIQSELSPLFYGNTSVFAFDNLSSLFLPTSDFFDSGERAAYKAAFSAIYNNAASAGANLLKPIGACGATAAAKVDSYSTAKESLAVNLNGLINGTGAFGVPGTSQNYSLARQLRTVFALMKGEQPGNVALGCRIFRVDIGGFDSHSNQGNYTAGSITTKVQNNFPGEFHGKLMHRLDRAISAFWQDCVDDGNLYKNTIILTFSEFGRRVEENGSHDANSGTDHGTAAPQFIIGPKAGQSAGPSHVVGGMYGAYPELDPPNLDGDGNIAFHLDFRHTYGEIINRWFGVDAPTTQSILEGYNYLTDPASADFLV